MNNVYWAVGAQEGLLSFGGDEEIRGVYMEVVTSEQSGRIGSGHKETVGAEGPWSKGHKGRNQEQPLDWDGWWGQDREGGQAVGCGGWGTGPASWAERAFQGPWVRGRAWEGGSVQAIEFGAAPLLGKKGGMAGQGSRDLDERGSWSRGYHRPGHQGPAWPPHCEPSHEDFHHPTLFPSCLLGCSCGIIGRAQGIVDRNVPWHWPRHTSPQ